MAKPAKEPGMSKKPKRKGLNSGANLAQRVALNARIDMLARASDTVHKDLEKAIKSKFYKTHGVTSEEELPLEVQETPVVPGKFPEGFEINFDAKSRTVKGLTEVGYMRRLETAMAKNLKALEIQMKEYRKPRPQQGKGREPRTERGR